MKDQIEKHELSESIYMSGHGLDHKDSDDIAEQLYTEGYRKQVEGEWLAKKEMYRTQSAKNYYCSNCAKSAIFDSFMGVSRQTNYCPNCGAKMKGGAE